MGNADDTIPYGKVRIHCKGCNETYFVGVRELKRKSEETMGFFPCSKCGSHDTSWEFRKPD